MKKNRLFIVISVMALAVAVSGCGDSSASSDDSGEVTRISMEDFLGTDNDGNDVNSISDDITGEESKPAVTEEASWETNAPETAEVPDFMLDLTEYEEYMNPGTGTEYLILVSPSHKLASDHIPQDLFDLADTRKDNRKTQQMREYAAKSMEAMFKELREAGYTDVSITSAYRSYTYQESLFNYYLSINNNDYDYVATFSNPPGSSEHQTGLCADLHNLPSADIAFGKKEAFFWLKDNCWKFGYILRYPEDKVEVTGISYEPWHYRYVGRYHAKRIYDGGLCLEEYMEQYYPELLK